jgi:hypothetical protein|tara:strand:- start:1404 stop:1610 length:207 start_codon:yes stop_codon:yes gene_type:complete
VAEEQALDDVADTEAVDAAVEAAAAAGGEAVTEEEEGVTEAAATRQGVRVTAVVDLTLEFEVVDLTHL